MNADSRSKILNSKMHNINNFQLAASNNETSNMLMRKDEDKEKKLDNNIRKTISMSWLDKLSSTNFITGGNIESEQDVKRLIKDSAIFFIENEKIKSSNKLNFSMSTLEKNQEINKFERISKFNCENKTNTIETIQSIKNVCLKDKMTAAVKIKMFSRMTRTESQWKPANLVCIRFNIAAPSIDLIIENTKKRKTSVLNSFTWSEISKFEKNKCVQLEFKTESSTSFKKKSSFKTILNIKDDLTKTKSETKNYSEDFYKTVCTKYGKVDNFESKKIENSANTLNIQKKKDLYKSIFLSSSEDSESESTEAKNTINVKLKTALIGKNLSELNTERNNSPPRGIFAELNFNKLFKKSWKKSNLEENLNNTINNTVKIKNDVSKINLLQKERASQLKIDDLRDSVDVYGPALPKVLKQSNKYEYKEIIFTDTSKKIDKIKDYNWVEKSKNKKLKKEKKHKHKKLSKIKNKKKSKKEKKRQD